VATATMDTVQNILKEIYEGRIEDQLQSEVVGTKRIEKTADGVVSNVGGKYVDFPIRVSRNSGLGYRKEMEPLPNAGTQGYNAVHVPLQYGYGVAKISGQTMRLAQSNAQAFASALDQEMNGLKSDIAKDQNRIFYGNGTGLMASVTADGSNSVTVDNIQYMEVGQVIDILTRADGTVFATDRTVTAVTPTTGNAGTVTYSGTDITATTAEGIYRAGNYQAGTNREPTGLSAIAATTGVLHNVDPSSVALWAGNEDNNSGTNRALSEGLMIKMCDTIRTKGSKVTAIFSGLGVRRAYFNLLTQQRRYTNTKDFAGGFTGLPFNYGTEIPVVEDVDCPPNTQFYVTEGDIRIYRDKAWHWADDDGDVMKWVSGYDVYTAYMRQYSEMGTSKRNAHGRIKDITEG
jgi:hypothetical protein